MKSLQFSLPLPFSFAILHKVRNRVRPLVKTRPLTQSSTQIPLFIRLMKKPISPAKIFSLVLCLFSLPLLTPAAKAAEEVAVPSGWDLSATLAFFRNLPLFDQAAFPETVGKVLCRFSEARNEMKDTVSFSNTYEFFRKVPAGGFLHLTVQETSRTEAPKDPSRAAVEVVADVRQELTVDPELPSGATERPELSKVIAYVLDHRQALVQSEAGKLAQSLNYTREGKERSGNYVQPRVTFLQPGETVSKIRVYGLEALLTDSARAALDGGKAIENRVLEFSADATGAAQVALVPLGKPEKARPE